MAGWSEITGHQDLIRYMRQAANSGNPSHAYLISGAPGSGKALLADTFAEALECTEADKPCGRCHACVRALSGSHPDIIHVTHEKPGLISVREIREQVVDDIAVRPYDGRYKIYIIEDADKMNPQAQNALLKTLEEPPAYGVILLLSAAPDALLATIRSRCTDLKVHNLADAEICSYLQTKLGMDPAKAVSYAAFAQGSLGKALDMAGSEEFGALKDEVIGLMKSLRGMSRGEILDEIKRLTDRKAGIREILDLMSAWFRDVLIYKSSGDEQDLLFPDEVSYVQEQADTVSWQGLGRIRDALADAGRRIKANVSFDLTADLLLSVIKENL